MANKVQYKAKCFIRHLSSINPIQCKRNWCLNWFVARIKLLSPKLEMLAGCSAGATSIHVDHHGHICKTRRTIS